MACIQLGMTLYTDIGFVVLKSHVLPILPFFKCNILVYFSCVQSSHEQPRAASHTQNKRLNLTLIFKLLFYDAMWYKHEQIVINLDLTYLFLGSSHIVFSLTTAAVLKGYSSFSLKQVSVIHSMWHACFGGVTWIIKIIIKPCVVALHVIVVYSKKNKQNKNSFI